MSLLKP